MRNKTFLAVFGLSLMTALAGTQANAQTAQQQQPQQVQARVVSTSQFTDANGRVGYDVTYEYDGRQYTTRTESHPGASIPVEVGPYGVATMPVEPQSSFPQYSQSQPYSPSSSYAPSQQAEGGSPWNQVVPEPGVVVSAGGRAPAPAYYPAPVYAAPVYPAPVYPAPVYVRPAYSYGAPYGYAAPYAYPPIGISLGLNYSRGWGGGYRRGWR